MFLTDDQIRELTKRQRPQAQARVLTYLGIPYQRRPDGTLVVLATHIFRDVKSTKNEPKLRL